MANLTNVDQQYEQQFTKPIIKMGRILNFLGIVFSFLPALYISIRYDAFPGASNILKGWALIVAIFGSYYIIEPVSYFPILGLPGTFMGFIAGNLGNMRVPCSALAQEAVGVEAGTNKAELVSTLGIAGSVITNLIVTVLAAVAGSYIISILPESVLSAFDFIAPSIFGSMYAMFAIKDLKSGLFALVLTVVLIKIGAPTFVIVPVTVFATIFYGLKTRKKGEK